MDKIHEQAASDADAICACLGLLACMAMHAQQMSGDGAVLAAEGSDKGRAAGARVRDGAAKALSTARRQIAALMNDFGDYFNGCDACSPTMEKLAEPIFEMLRKREDGISLVNE